jgi:hypothetical protein
MEMPGAFAEGHAMVEGAVARFAGELGRRVRERRAAIPLGPEGMPAAYLAAMLTALGISMSEEDIGRLEDGKGPVPDVKFLIALAFLLEFSTDEVIVTCLRAAGGAMPGSP